LLLSAVEPLGFRQREAFLEMDAAAHHALTGAYALVKAAWLLCAERSGQSFYHLPCPREDNASAMRSDAIR
jgi:hypothetical protein